MPQPHALMQPAMVTDSPQLPAALAAMPGVSCCTYATDSNCSNRSLNRSCKARRTVVYFTTKPSKNGLGQTRRDI